MPAVITCGTCGGHWTGQRACHCGGCHITTSSLTAFDRHQTVHGCQDPQAAGLTPTEKSWGALWGTPVREGADPEWWKRRRSSESAS